MAGCRALVAGELGRIEETFLDGNELILFTYDDFNDAMDGSFTRVGVAGLLIGVEGLVELTRRLDGVAARLVGVDERTLALDAADLLGVEGLAMGREIGVVERDGVDGRVPAERDFRETELDEVVTLRSAGSCILKLLRATCADGSALEAGSDLELPPLAIAFGVGLTITDPPSDNPLPTGARSRPERKGVTGGVMSQS